MKKKTQEIFRRIAVKDSMSPQLILFALVVAAIFLLTGCITLSKSADHRFSFRINGKNPDVEILDYKYGESRGLPTEPSPGELRQGQIAQSAGITGIFSVGGYLYVKWLVKKDSTIAERKIDLKPLLPRNMNDKHLHFSFKGPDLYVYLISWGKRHAPHHADCPAVGYEVFECTTIYTTKKKNF